MVSSLHSTLYKVKTIDININFRIIEYHSFTIIFQTLSTLR